MRVATTDPATPSALRAALGERALRGTARLALRGPQRPVAQSPSAAGRALKGPGFLAPARQDAGNR